MPVDIRPISISDLADRCSSQLATRLNRHGSWESREIYWRAVSGKPDRRTAGNVESLGVSDSGIWQDWERCEAAQIRRAASCGGFPRTCGRLLSSFRGARLTRCRGLRSRGKIGPVQIDKALQRLTVASISLTSHRLTNSVSPQDRAALVYTVLVITGFDVGAFACFTAAFAGPSGAPASRSPSSR